MQFFTRGALAGALALAGTAVAGPATAEQPGVTATEIRIGQTTSYSGPASQYGQIGKTQAAFFRMINEKGGINGRRINFISLDDGYSPPKSVEQMRRLVEQDEVAFMFNSFGGPTNAAQAKYLNQKHVPQLFVGTGADYWGNVQLYPWSMGWQPSFRTEARIYAKAAIAAKPATKFGILLQNDDFGKDYLLGLKDVVDAQKEAKIVAEATYLTTDATVDSQIINLRAAGAEAVILAAVPKFAAQAIRKMIELEWNPAVYVSLGASGLSATTEPARGRSGLNLYSGSFLKDWNTPEWRQDPGAKAFLAFMQAYAPDMKVDDFAPVYGYSVAQTLMQVLKQCGDDFSRENIMRQASSLKALQLPLLIDGITINTSATDHYPIEQVQLTKWNGDRWQPYGAIIEASR